MHISLEDFKLLKLYIKHHNSHTPTYYVILCINNIRKYIISFNKYYIVKLKLMLGYFIIHVHKHVDHWFFISCSLVSPCLRVFMSTTRIPKIPILPKMAIDNIIWKIRDRRLSLMHRTSHSTCS